nr:MAG TPA: hypothetical protein [Caudoviricetes sp.]
MIDSTFHLFGFYINIYIMMKRIRIGIQEAKFALSDKNRLDAFCLLLKIKLLFRSSDLNLVSYNHCAKLLHIDNNKLKRLLEYGCKIGYFRFEEKNGKKRFIARSIHSNNGYSYKLRKDDLTKMTFPALKNLLRRIVMENQVRMQEDVINTHNKGTNGGNAKTIRKALKRESRMLRKKFSDNKGLSYDRIKDVIYGTMYQAFKVTNQLVNKGIINKRTRIKEVRCDAKVCTNNMAITDFEGSIIVISAKNRSAFSIESNIYRMQMDDAISISRHGMRRKEAKM